MNRIQGHSTAAYWEQLNNLRHDYPSEWVVFSGNKLLGDGEPWHFENCRDAHAFINDQSIVGVAVVQVPA